MVFVAQSAAQPVKTEPNPAGNWPYPYDHSDDS